MKYVIFLLLAAVLLGACSAAPQPAPAAASPSIPPTPTATPVVDVVIESWVDRPNPAQDQRVIVFGALRTYGVYRSGLLMTAAWPDEDHENGEASCWIRTNYEKGTCVIEAAGFPPGVFVPVTVTIELDGVNYTTQTGFTPQ